MSTALQPQNPLDAELAPLSPRRAGLLRKLRAVVVQRVDGRRLELLAADDLSAFHQEAEAELALRIRPEPGEESAERAIRDLLASGEISQALRDEVLARQARPARIPFKSGAFLRTRGQGARTQWRYALIVGAGIKIPFGVPSLLIAGVWRRVSRGPYQAETGSLEVLIPCDLGHQLGSGKLRFDDGLLLRGIERFYDDLNRDPTGLNFELMAAPAGLIPVSQLGLPPELHGPIPADLDPDRQRALECVRQNPFTLIWGHPGSGKTRTLAVILADLIVAGKTILVVCPSHDALKTIAEALLARLGPDKESYKLVLNGPPSRYDVIELQKISTPAVLSRMKEELRRELRDLKARTPDATKTQQHTPLEIREGQAVVESSGPRATGELDPGAQEAELKRRLALLDDGVIDSCQVVFATIYAALLNPDIRDHRVDCVVVDEAGAASVGLVLPVVGLARERVVAAGDPRQLGPIVQGRTPLINRWLRRSVFEASRVVAAIGEGLVFDGLCRLSQQYRMDPLIAELDTEISYRDHPLVTAREVLERPRDKAASGSSMPACPLLLVDTTNVASTPPSGKSRANEAHVAVVVRLSERLEADGYSDVGVITPYVGHVSAIRRAVPPGFGQVPVATVHSYQGSEKDRIILDLSVDGLGDRVLTEFLIGYAESDEATRLLNVACSRAKRQLIVIARLGYIRGAAPTGSSLERMLEFMLLRGTVVDARDLS